MCSNRSLSAASQACTARAKSASRWIRVIRDVDESRSLRKDCSCASTRGSDTLSGSCDASWTIAESLAAIRILFSSVGNVEPAEDEGFATALMLIETSLFLSDVMRSCSSSMSVLKWWFPATMRRPKTSNFTISLAVSTTTNPRAFFKLLRRSR